MAEFIAYMSFLPSRGSFTVLDVKTERMCDARTAPSDRPCLSEQTSRGHLAGRRAYLQGRHSDRPRLHSYGYGRYPNRIRPVAGRGNSPALEDSRAGRGLSVMVDQADDHV